MLNRICLLSISATTTNSRQCCFMVQRIGHVYGVTRMSDTTSDICWEPRQRLSFDARLLATSVGNRARDSPSVRDY
ncbi:unnamed protein product [Acanthoscelides obtectus]|uniref:Uncharacterized protein n=1 Tax=Acanthoscelides obtectus TaxID=200917 RepID=A0A9P0LT01_ACAOB|nr:unnamed protein product [Acanthoscelides obtectus]CAK1669487.1 hypothetical protein AOBTE_LOCUS27029 [Acanthoscelides obtectus]